MNGEINWGDEIRVDGVRPEWLGYGEKHQWIGNGVGDWKIWDRGANFIVDIPGDPWGSVTHIRLPADHPHYVTISHATAQNGGEVWPEVVERMIALVRRMGGNSSIGQPFYEFEAITHSAAHYDEARAIVALLPEPVDADLVEAREVCADITGEDAHEQHGFVSGDFDNGEIMLCALAAIKRGRALEKDAGR